MTKERMLDMANLVVDATKLDRFVADITIGNSATGMQIYTNNFNVSPSRCIFFTTEDSEYNNGLEYVYDPNFEKAEEYIRGILVDATPFRFKGDC